MSEGDLTKQDGVNGMPTRQATDSTSSRPQSILYDDPPEEEIQDAPREEFESQKPNSSSKRHLPKNTLKEDPSKPPAYVAPIPKIGRIPRIERNNITSSGRPQFPRYVTSSLVGKRIDEFGDVVDDDGKILGRVAGDLPSMVGRSVLNQRGDVLGDDGELLGYVAEVESAKDDSRVHTESETGDEQVPPENTPRQGRPDTQSMGDYMNARNSAFHIDQEGNILDQDNNVVGSFHDYNRMGPKPKRPVASEPKEPKAEESSEPSKPKEKQQPAQEARPNAQSWRKENPSESPSDIFLDVKSTHEGIQLTIRIPTVFPGGGQPQVRFT